MASATPTYNFTDEEVSHLANCDTQDDLIERSCFDYHSHYTSSLITIDDFIFNVNIYPAWVTFNNLLLFLVLIAAAICSLIFLYA